MLFGDAVTITADGPWQHLLYQLTGRKWGNLDVENETGCGIVPYVYKDRSLVNAVQWAVGLELLLLITDPWRVFLTTDHPNGGCFWRYPEIIQLLMDVEFRKAQVRQLPEAAQQRIVLARSRPAIHALRDRDHHVGGPGARPGSVAEGAPRRRRRCRRGDLSGEAGRRMPVLVSAVRAQGRRDRRRGRRRAAVERGARVHRPARRTTQQIEEYLRPLFQKVYTISFENYPVAIERLRQPEHA